MRRVAVVAPDFAPSSYPPSIRARLFTRHLPEYGWQPSVISTKPESYEWEVDREIESLLPPELHVVRTGAIPIAWSRRFGIGDLGLRTLVHHWTALGQLCRSQQIDLVFISVPPSISMLLGRLAYERYRVPYVIDYQDPWGPPELGLRQAWSRSRKLAAALAMARTLEPIAVKRAAHITGVSQGTIEAVAGRYSWIAQSDMTEVPFGAEETDFQYVDRHPRRNHVFATDDGLVHVSYVGAYIPQMGEALRAVFQAVRLGLERHPAAFQRLRLHFIGTTYAPAAPAEGQVIEVADQMGIRPVVDERPARVSYLDAIQLMLDSHALMILGSNTPYYAASKLYPSILARRPLLTLLHEDSASAVIVRDMCAGELVTFGPHRPASQSLEQIYGWLETLIQDRARLVPPTRWDVFERHTARAMTARLSSVFDTAISKPYSDHREPRQ